MVVWTTLSLQTMNLPSPVGHTDIPPEDTEVRKSATVLQAKATEVEAGDMLDHFNQAILMLV
jgi:hypothetical protein